VLYAEVDRIVHSVAMRDRTHATSAKFVRLSHLRKLCECEQAAAVCYRVCARGIEFLLVRTGSGVRWTFPKGSAEPGLTHAQAAALEAFEEAGVHGRIEEASFARYVRRERGARKSDARSGKREVAVYAHLCEVSRLSPPKESRRNRTWFSVDDARHRLREGRNSADGAEFVRVIDRAVVRIQQLRRETGIADRPQDDRIQQDRLHPDTMPKDGLQEVQFEASMETREASFLQRLRRQLHGMRQFDVPPLDDHSREFLRGEVLQFDPAREKKTKALGTGTNSRG
jgi:8-oxo-dGTP pyrophosphatase MutT (NUDIX family)